MRVSQEDSTVKKTHAAMKTVCRRCHGARAVATCQAAVPATTWCLEPPLARVPKHDWFCPRTSRARHAAARAVDVLPYYGFTACAKAAGAAGARRDLGGSIAKHSAMLAPGVLLVCFTVKKTVPVLLEDKY